MRWSNTHGFASRTTSIAILALLLSTPSSHSFGVVASPVALPNLLKHNHIDGDLVDSSFLSGQAFADAAKIINNNDNNNNNNNDIITQAKPSFPRRILLQMRRASSSPSSSSRPSPSPPSARFLSAYETIVNSDSQLPMFLDHKLQRQQRRRARMANMSKHPQPSDNHNKNAIDSNEALRPRIATNNVQNNMAENAMSTQGPGDEVKVVTHDRSSTQGVPSASKPATDKNRWALRNSLGMEEEMDGEGVMVENKEDKATLIGMSEKHMEEEKAGGVALEDLSFGMQVQHPSSEGASFSSEEHPLSQKPAEVQVEDIPVPEIEPIVFQHSDRDVLEPRRSIRKRSSQFQHHRHLVTSASSSSSSSRSALHSALASAFVVAASGLALSFVVISYSMYSRRREKSPLGFFHYLTQGAFDSSYSYGHLSEASSLLPVATIPSPTSAVFPFGVSALSASSSSSCSGNSSGEEPEIAVSSCAQVTPSASYKADVGRRASRQLLVESKIEHQYKP
ncbi:hypothetical protein BG006_011460 [Podila minutissima]|uniref:Transmembrane protein n=1 Tax=Podila minutissima TaxID=64525 RepID=A0A9P5SSZ8_9FUNG|nr:hypothetical protein BG006_011460 [Podila minutissima]